MNLKFIKEYVVISLSFVLFLISLYFYKLFLSSVGDFTSISGYRSLLSLNYTYGLIFILLFSASFLFVLDFIKLRSHTGAIYYSFLISLFSGYTFVIISGNYLYSFLITIFVFMISLVYFLNALKELDIYKKPPYDGLAYRFVKSAIYTASVVLAIAFASYLYFDYGSTEEQVDDFLYSLTGMYFNDTDQLLNSYIDQQKESYLLVANSTYLYLMSYVYSNSDLTTNQKYACMNALSQGFDSYVDQYNSLSSTSLSLPSDVEQNLNYVLSIRELLITGYGAILGFLFFTIYVFFMQILFFVYWVMLKIYRYFA